MLFGRVKTSKDAVDAGAGWNEAIRLLVVGNAQRGRRYFFIVSRIIFTVCSSEYPMV
jgi:hypothetical protein